MTDKRSGVVARVGAWIGVTSAAITVILTVLNGLISNRIQEAELNISRQAQVQQEARDRISRYTFVQALLSDLAEESTSQQELITNLIRLALTEDEANRLFGGLEASEDSTISNFGRNAGAIQRRAEIYDLISQLDSREQHQRLSAATQLVSEYASDPMAIERAVTQLEMPRLAGLSADGRVNVMVYLSGTTITGWSRALLDRASDAAANIERRDQDGIAVLGNITRDRLSTLVTHLGRVGDALR